MYTLTIIFQSVRVKMEECAQTAPYFLRLKVAET